MRAPDLIIGPKDNPYIHRWHLWRWRGWQLSLHKIFRSDDDRALHDHTANNVSFILKGWYSDITGRRGAYKVKHCRRFSLIFRKAETPHRIFVHTAAPVWTLWLRGPPRREWGFHCPQGWRHWKQFVASQDYSQPGSVSEAGPGCN